MSSTSLGLLEPTLQISLSVFVPSGRIKFIEDEHFFSSKWVFKFLKRRLFISLLGQCSRKLHLDEIPSNTKRILWINLSAPSLGDALMDCASRVLLTKFHVDLYTSKQNIAIFYEDEVFSRVTSNRRQAQKWHLIDSYDLIICDSFAPRVFIEKVRVSYSCPYVSLYEYINGYDVHRTYFSYSRMSYLTRNHVERKKLDFFPVISRRIRDYDVTKYLGALVTANSYICVAIGGEWPFRTYTNWLEVFSCLDVGTLSRVVLVGSKNGVDLAVALQRKFPVVVNTVGKTDLKEVAAIIGQSAGFVGADGGLWHIACAFRLSSVVLFASCDLFDESGTRTFRTTDGMDACVHYDENSVSNIDPILIANSIGLLSRKIPVERTTLN